jgi:hypothetical protein
MAAQDIATETLERRLEFAGLPQGWHAVAALVLLALLLYAAAHLYRREQRAGASARIRVLLAFLRCAVLVVLALVWLQPVIATYIRRNIESPTLLLVDGSASMSLRDRYADEDQRKRVARVLAGQQGDKPESVSRADIARTALARDKNRLIRELSQNNPLLIYDFGDRVELIRQYSAASQPAADSFATVARASAPGTDVGTAVRQAVESQAGRPISAVVVMSDGQFNQGEPVEAVAGFAKAKRLAIHTVGIGDPAPPRNATVTALEAPPSVFVNDPFKITARISAQGLAGEPLTIELLEIPPDAPQPAAIATRTLTVGADGRVEPVTFNHQLARAAQTRLSVRIRPVEGESITDDNERETSVRALENKMRVLLVAGAPTWEYRYLSRLLTRDATVDASCWLQPADAEAVRDGKTIIDPLPRKREELAVYDCIILMDPRPADLDAEWNKTFETLVSQAGTGLLFVAGRKNTSRLVHEPSARPLLDLLPVVIDAGQADLIINEEGYFQQTAWPMAIAPQASGHPVLNLADQPEENAQTWARLPGVYWHYPVSREKPVATVLLRHSNPQMRNTYGQHVLLATQFVGAGRSAFMAWGDTWRWRRAGDRYFNHFWIMLIRHLVEGKLLGGQKRGLIQPKSEQCAVGEAVTVEARLLDAAFAPLSRDAVELNVRAEDRPAEKVVLTAQPDRPGWYRGEVTPTTTGLHQLRIDLPAEGSAPATAIIGELRVGRPDLEFRRTPLDRQSLENLAANSAGGRYLHIDEIDQLPSLIPSRSVSMVVTGPPIPLWDRWWTLALLVALLSVEWAVRKAARLL